MAFQNHFVAEVFGSRMEGKLSGKAPGEAAVRKLKIEADGDFWRGLTKPKIRLMGRWLERAGFSPGSYVEVTCVSPGILELRTSNPQSGKDPKETATDGRPLDP